MKYKIEIERPLCIACQTCTIVCPEFWEMADDGYSHLIGSISVGENEEREVEEAGCNMKAAENCPVSCIHVYQQGKKII